MSLESQVAELVTATNALVATFSGKKNEINAAVAAAIAAAPETTRMWFVDQINGLDTNLGTKESPFRTIEKAVKSTPSTGLCQVNLLNDYTLDYEIPLSCAYLHLYGSQAATQPKLRLKYFSKTQGGVASTLLGGFVLSGQGANVEMRSVDLILPSTSGVTPAPTSSRSCSFLRTAAGASLPPLIGASFSTLAVNMADSTFFGCLIDASTCSVAFNANSASFPAGFGGKYFNGVASGSDPKALSNVITNLTAL